MQSAAKQREIFMDGQSISVDEELLSKIDILLKTSLRNIVDQINVDHSSIVLDGLEERQLAVGVALISAMLKAAAAMASAFTIREELFLGLTILFYRRAAEEIDEIMTRHASDETDQMEKQLAPQEIEELKKRFASDVAGAICRCLFLPLKELN